MEIAHLTEQDEMILPGWAVRPAVYAELLAVLLEGARAYIGVVIWRHRVGPWRKRYGAVCGSETRLVSRTADGQAVLELPDWRRLRQLRLTVFYPDDSVLTVGLGAGDLLTVLKQGDGDARRRMKSAREVLKTRGWHPDSLTLIGLLLLTLLLVIVFVLIHADLAVFVTGLVGLCIYFCIPMSTGSGGLRPRPSRIGASWLAMGWGREDLRRLITGVLTGAILLGIGIWIGHK